MEWNQTSEHRGDYKKTRIIATVGPASSNVETIRSLIRAGADCFRVNFSHGDGPGLQPLMDMIRQAEKEEGVFVPILADIQGPKIRVGKMPREGVQLVEGKEILLTTKEEIEGTEEKIYTPYRRLSQDVSPGARILLADGTIELRAEEVLDEEVRCRILIGGRLTSNKGINLPDSRLSVDTLTEKDRRDLEYISKSDIDLVAISFVRSAHDIIRAQTLIDNPRIPVVAKLERPEALEHLNDILEVSDGVMVARGDLGVEMEFDQVPTLQKQILHRAALRGKWTVVATQMLGSMVMNSRPTRAEVSDVAYAVIDGADAVMLSEETAMGNHPVKAVEAMARIVRTAAAVTPPPTERFEDDIVSFAAAAAGAAVSAAERLRASAIIALAGSGTTALLLSKWHPKIPIISLSSAVDSCRRNNILRGVISFQIEGRWDMEEQLACADARLIERGLARSGDVVIVVAAIPLGEKKETNTIRFHKVRGNRQNGY